MTAPLLPFASQRRVVVGAVDTVADHRSSPFRASKGAAGAGSGAAAPAVDAVDALTGDAGARSEAEFDAIFATQKTRLYAIAFSVLRDRGEAEDAVQETMWRAWKNWTALRDPSKREAWLTRICLNHCFRRKSKLARVHVAGQDETTGEVASPWAADPVMRSAGAGPSPVDHDLDAAFLVLPLKQRAAVLLHYHYGYTIEQCGELMGCRSGTVRTHVQRALARMREELGDE